MGRVVDGVGYPVGYLADYQGLWAGEAWLTYHSYGWQAHRSLTDAVMWCKLRIAKLGHL